MEENDMFVFGQQIRLNMHAAHNLCCALNARCVCAWKPKETEPSGHLLDCWAYMGDKKRRQWEACVGRIRVNRSQSHHICCGENHNIIARLRVFPSFAKQREYKPIEMSCGLSLSVASLSREGSFADKFVARCFPITSKALVIKWYFDWQTLGKKFDSRSRRFGA